MLKENLNIRYPRLTGDEKDGDLAVNVRFDDMSAMKTLNAKSRNARRHQTSICLQIF